MSQRPISKITAVLLALFAMMHLGRLIRGSEVEIDGWLLPMFASLAAVLIGGVLAILLWRESNRFIERRRVPRRRAIHLVSLRQSGEANPDEVAVILGRTLALSPGGATIETNEALEIGTRMDLELAVDAEIVEAHGKVVHVDPDSEGRFEVGVKFDSDPTG